MKLKKILKKRSGRNSQGKVTVRHQGGAVKRFIRNIDFKRDKAGVWGKVSKIEKDPNRNAFIALITYEDGDKRYILAPAGVEVGSRVVASADAPVEPGNALPLTKIPVGTLIHNIEIVPGKGGQLARSAGSSSVIQGFEAEFALVKMPSGEIRRIKKGCWATVGQVGNLEARTRIFGKAGTRRRLGIRPTVRGVAMHPAAHPHGGGEGRSSVGLKFPKTPWGKKAVGNTRNKRKYSKNLIVQKRKGARSK